MLEEITKYIEGLTAFLKDNPDVLKKLRKELEIKENEQNGG